MNPSTWARNDFKAGRVDLHLYQHNREYMRIWIKMYRNWYRNANRRKVKQ